MGDEKLEEPKKAKRVVVESLGWLTESTIMPKKHRAIAGVGASSMMELKAQLYQSQEDSKKSNNNESTAADVIRAKKKVHDAFSVKNSGVDARAHKDKLQMKAVKDGSASYTALEKKAALYEKLARGELSDEEEKEKYCVDFYVKKNEQEAPEQSRREDLYSAAAPEEGQDGETDLSTLFSRKPMGLGQAGATWDNDEHKRFVREVHQEANQAREKVSELKVRRLEQAIARREKLKQAYIKKQLEKLKAGAPNKEQT